MMGQWLSSPPEVQHFHYSPSVVVHFVSPLDLVRGLILVVRCKFFWFSNAMLPFVLFLMCCMVQRVPGFPERV